MCGIVGIVNTNGNPVEQILLKDMAACIAHRGPDDEDCHIAGQIGLYHKRLAIIDLATGRQPMTRDGLTIVFNGEIYNYVEKQEELKALGHRFRTTSDTEVILALYQQYGIDFVHHLNGMFAFLLYDQQQQKLIAVRDHFGIKPLYYTLAGESALFASEIKALLKHPAVSAVPDYEAIQDYLTFQYVLGPNTLFRGISKILPGHYQIINLGSHKTQTVKYWSPDFSVDTHHTEVYFIYKLRELLEDSVRIQLRSDVPLGAYLSGGMDSSLVTLMAARHYPGRLKTFTGGFREGRHFDETAYAREVVDACGAEMHEIFPTQADFIDWLPKLVYHMDEPAAGPGLFPQFMVSRLASQEVKVVLGGQGGDEIFGGYTRFMVAYLEQALKGAIYGTTEEGEHIVSLKTILKNLHYLRQYVPMMRSFWKEGLFEQMDQRYFQLIDRSGGDMNLLDEDFRADFDRQAIFERFQQIFNNPKTLSYFNKMVHFDMVASLPALLHVEDRVSMAVSLESRVPILDHRIVELIISMPPAMKFKGAEMKYILKRAVDDILPPKILNREDKMGFPVPLHIWARQEAKSFFRDILTSSAARSRGLYNMNAVEQLIEQENAFGRKLWGLLNLELWFQTFIDR